MTDRLRRVYRWIADVDLAMLIAVSVVVVSSYVLVRTINEVIRGESEWFDRMVMSYVASIPLDKRIEEAVRDITALGGAVMMSLVTACVLVYLALSRRWHAAVLLLVNSAGAVAVSMTMKYFFDRDRPDFMPHGSHTVTSSFPSGHSMLSTTLYLTLAVLLARLERSRWMRLYFVAVALLVAFLVGISRILLGVHWPTDVLAGWSAGVLWATIGWFVLRALQRRGTVESPGSLDSPGTMDASQR